MNEILVTWGGGNSQFLTEAQARSEYEECERRVQMTRAKYANRKRGLSYEALSDVRSWEAKQAAILARFGWKAIRG